MFKSIQGIWPSLLTGVVVLLTAHVSWHFAHWQWMMPDDDYNQLLTKDSIGYWAGMLIWRLTTIYPLVIFSIFMVVFLGAYLFRRGWRGFCTVILAVNVFYFYGVFIVRVIKGDDFLMINTVDSLVTFFVVISTAYFSGFLASKMPLTKV